NLYRKGWLRRERDRRAWRYEPTGSRSSYTSALMNDALATSPDRRTALTHFALQMSPNDAALLREALEQALGKPEAGDSRGPSGRRWWRTPPVSASWGPGSSAGPGGRPGRRCWPSLPTGPRGARLSPRSGWPA